MTSYFELTGQFLKRFPVIRREVDLVEISTSFLRILSPLFLALELFKFFNKKFVDHLDIKIVITI